MIFLVAGTSDAKQLAIELAKNGHRLVATVVTETAASELRKHGIEALVGRRTIEQFTQLLTEYQVDYVVDASHPYAELGSKNAIAAAKEASIPYIRYERKSEKVKSSPLVMIVSSYEEAADLATKKKGVIMLTTGSKTLPIFSGKLLNNPDIRLLIRMLPTVENLSLCQQLQFPQKNIIAIQGPFSKQFNKALFDQFGVTTMITKESGKEGSFVEKLEAAQELRIETIVIARPSIEYGTVYSTFQDVISHIHRGK